MGKESFINFQLVAGFILLVSFFNIENDPKKDAIKNKDMQTEQKLSAIKKQLLHTNKTVSL